MKKIVGIVSVLALVAGSVFADPDVTPTVTSFNGNAGLEYVLNLDSEESGFKNNTWTEFKVQFKNADWGGKSTSGDGMWGEVNVRTEGDVTLTAPTDGTKAKAWEFGPATIGAAKLHFVDGDTYVNMVLLQPSYKIGEITGKVALYNHGWDPLTYFAGVDPTDGKYKGFQVNFGIPVVDVSVAFGDRGYDGTKTKDQTYAYKAAATVKPIDGLAIGAAVAGTTEKDSKIAAAANVTYKYTMDDGYYVAPFANFTMNNDVKAVNAAVLFGWGGQNAQWNHDFIQCANAPAANNTYATDGVSVQFGKADLSKDDMALEVAAYDSVLLNKVIPGDTKVAAKYAAAKDLGKGALGVAAIYGNKVDIINITARASFGMDLGADTNDFAYGLKVNTTEVIQNTDLYVDYVGGKDKKGTITCGAKISF